MVNDAYVREIVDKNIDVFLREIRNRSEINPYRNIWVRESEFELLLPVSKSFYQYEYYERLLEWYIRTLLVNPSLQDLFDVFGIEYIWPELRKIVPLQSNDSREEDYPFQFYLIKDGKMTGYKYTKNCSQYKDFAHLLKKHTVNKRRIDNIVILDWTLEEKKKANDDDRVTAISFVDFVISVFGKETGEYYIDELKKAVKKANEEIGLQTISNLSLRHLSRFTDELMESVKNKNYEGLRYRVLYVDKKDPADISENYEKLVLCEKDLALLANAYKKKELYRALTGNKGFAKCFVTAEYLYNVFKDNKGYFDYTSIVCGYLKAVEQLVYSIVKINLATASVGDDFWIKGKYPSWKKDKNWMSRINPNNKEQKVSQVRFLTCNEKYFDVSLTPMLWFLKDNNRYGLSSDGIDKIHSILMRYAQECRNDHFHKDNITDFDNIVEGIRDNTYLVLYYLLGGCLLSGDELRDKVELGIVDDSFTRLYKRLLAISRSVRHFCILINGEEISAMRIIDQGDVGYDQYGYISESTIKFVKTENYTKIEDEPNMKVDLELSADNMPEKIWYYRQGDEKVLIEW